MRGQQSQTGSAPSESGQGGTRGQGLMLRVARPPDHNGCWVSLCSTQPTFDMGGRDLGLPILPMLIFYWSAGASVFFCATRSSRLRHNK